MQKSIVIMLAAVLALVVLAGTASAESFSSPLFPAFESMSFSGSALDVSGGSFSSGVGAAFIGTPPKVNYGISLHGLGDLPAYGSVSAFGSSHFQSPSSDISYSSSASASGMIKAFSVSYSFGL